MRPFAPLQSLKVVSLLFVALALAASLVANVQQFRHRHDVAALARVQMTVNDSTKAQAARETPSRGALPGATDAAKTMGGTLVAGVKIVVKPETTFVAVREVVTVHDTVGARTATLTDTAPGGYVVTVRGEAPATGALKLGYSLVTPEFHPEVGFVQRPEGYYAVVTWAGHTATPTRAFYTPAHERPLALVAGAAVNSTLLPSATPVRVSAYGGVAYRQLQLRVGLDNATPVVGLAYSTRW